MSKHTGFDSLEIWAISKLTVILGGEWRCGTVAVVMHSVQLAERLEL